MNYSDFIKINPIFQNSINLQFDLNNPAKIKEYIPTREACSILRRYISSMLPSGEKTDRATVLYGPYGKGKSFLILILLFLVSGDAKSSVFIELLQKIKEVDSALFDDVCKLRLKSFRLLPVIINSDYDNLDQAFLIGLTEALDSAGIKNDVLKTTFDVAMEVMAKWKNDATGTYSLIENCLKKQSTSYNKLLSGLAKKDSGSYERFCNLYECVSGGIPFNPLIKKNAATSLRTVAEGISSEYAGLFVVFDEFSKFIESGVPGLSQQLKVLQDTFEAATRSSDKRQIHICCVNHKKLSNYGKSIATESISSFRTVEGRVKEISFTRTIGENYWIVSKAFIKGKAFDSFWEKYNRAHSDEFEWFVEKGFVDSEEQDDLFKGCFPLNPLAAFSLIQLSEMVAQNERTLFTFISDNDRASLNSFIHHNSSDVYRVDSIYDYFSPLFEKEEESETKNSWIKAESILSQLIDENEKRIVKAVAVAQIIKDSRLFPSTFEYLDKALGINNLASILDSLEDRSFLMKDFVTNCYTLSAYSTKEINKAIQDYRLKHSITNFSDVLNTISPVRFLPSRRYNIEHKMVRYYKTEYIEASSFCKLASLRNEEDVLSDGVVFQVYFASDISKEDVLKVYSKLKKDPCIIVAVSSSRFTDKDAALVSDYCSLNGLCSTSEKINELLLNEMMLLREGMKSSIKAFLEEMFANSLFLSDTDESSISEIMNHQLEATYRLSPVINNELLNKHEPSKVYQKSRNTIVDRILTGQTDFSDLSDSSAEMSVYKSVFATPNNRVDVVVFALYTKLRLLEGRKQEFSCLTELLAGVPYGIREGVMPLLIAKAVSDLPDHFVLYYGNKEIVLDANNLAKAIEKPNDYKFVVQKGSAEKTDFLEALAESFSVPVTHSFWRDLAVTVDGISKHFSMLPNIVRMGSIDSIIGVDPKARKMVSEFLKYDINRYEIIFSTLPNLFAGSNHCSYKLLYDWILRSVECLDDGLDSFIYIVSGELRVLFGGEDCDSLKSSIDSWLLKNGIQNRSSLSLSSVEKKVFDTICSDRISFLDSDVVNLVAKAATGSMVADWQKDKTKELCKVVSSVIEKMQQAPTKEEIATDNTPFNTPLSVLGEMAKKAIQASIDEYGESISREEKIQLLKAIIQELKA